MNLTIHHRGNYKAFTRERQSFLLPGYPGRGPQACMGTSVSPVAPAAGNDKDRGSPFFQEQSFIDAPDLVTRGQKQAKTGA
ncbi:hypothetical protein C5O22_05945 [Treponema sp. J25]|nr:hypothetical protein C5O22_05945 [Treponema sp. J25]